MFADFYYPLASMTRKICCYWSHGTYCWQTFPEKFPSFLENSCWCTKILENPRTNWLMWLLFLADPIHFALLHYCSDKTTYLFIYLLAGFIALFAVNNHFFSLCHNLQLVAASGFWLMRKNMDNQAFIITKYVDTAKIYKLQYLYWNLMVELWVFPVYSQLLDIIAISRIYYFAYGMFFCIYDIMLFINCIDSIDWIENKLYLRLLLLRFDAFSNFLQKKCVSLKL